MKQRYEYKIIKGKYDTDYGDHTCPIEENQFNDEAADGWRVVSLSPNWTRALLEKPTAEVAE